MLLVIVFRPHMSDFPDLHDDVIVKALELAHVGSLYAAGY